MITFFPLSGRSADVDILKDALSAACLIEKKRKSSQIWIQHTSLKLINAVEKNIRYLGLTFTIIYLFTQNKLTREP